MHEPYEEDWSPSLIERFLEEPVRRRFGRWAGFVLLAGWVSIALGIGVVAGVEGVGIFLFGSIAAFVFFGL